MGEETTCTTMAGPFGDLLLTARDGALSGVYLPGERWPRVAPAAAGDAPVLEAASEQLAGWLEGRRREFDLPLAPAGTPFDRRVRAEVMAVPFGRTATYGELAARVGRPEAARALGAAVGRNRLIIVVPCHRVVGAGGRLTGFRAGLEHKRRLLDHEGGALALAPQG